MLVILLTGPKTYYLWLLFLLAVIAGCGLVYLQQLQEGLSITGMSRDVSWGLYISQFTYLVGVAASAVMLTGDLISAWNYLSKVEADPRAWNNIGVLNLMEGNPEGAAIWFRKAVGVEPRKARANLQLVERMIK